MTGDEATDGAAGETTIVVDVANVMGSRPDGWWRDRAGAAVRMYRDLTRLAVSGRPVPVDPVPVDPVPVDGARPEFIMVIEGAAKGAAARIGEEPGPVRTVLAPGSGDDEIVAVVRELGGDCYVVTADRELRARCVAQGAKILGPGWLLGLLREPGRDDGLRPPWRGKARFGELCQ